MLKFMKFGGLVVGLGVLIGGLVVVWLSLHREDLPAAEAGGGSVALDASTVPTNTPAVPDDLHVSSPSAVASGGGAPETLLPNGTSDRGEASASAPSPTPTPAADDFGQYEKYKDNSVALFGDVTVGQGAAVATGSVVSVQYRGWLTNGTLFDESYSKPAPFTFTEGDHRVIAGWEEGLLGMKVGGKRRLVVPPGVGYGSAAQGSIPANSVLVFDIELLSVK